MENRIKRFILFLLIMICTGYGNAIAEKNDFQNSILMLLLDSPGAYNETEEGSITIDIDIEKNKFIVSGAVTKGAGNSVVMLMLDSNNNIAAIDQVYSDYNGNYKFEYAVSEKIIGEVYKIYVRGIETGLMQETIEYVGEESEPDEPEIQDENIFEVLTAVNIKNYVPTITGSLLSKKDMDIHINILDKNSNESVLRDIIAGTGEYIEFSYTLPTLLVSRNWNFTVECKDKYGEYAYFVLDTDISSNILSISVNGSIKPSTGFMINADIQAGNTGLISKSGSYSAEKTFSATIPNVLANMSCSVDLTGVENTGYGESVGNYITVVENVEYFLSIGDINAEYDRYEVIYDPDIFEVTDVIGITDENDNEAGDTAESGITIISNEAGKARFVCNNNLKAVNIVKLKAKKSGNGVITVRNY